MVSPLLNKLYCLIVFHTFLSKYFRKHDLQREILLLGSSIIGFNLQYLHIRIYVFKWFKKVTKKEKKKNLATLGCVVTTC